MPKRPLIGLTLDAEQPGGYSKYPWYAIRQNYASAISAAGGLPVCLPHDPDLTRDYLGRLDGLIITGGKFDIDPQLYGDKQRHSTTELKSGRTDAELSLLQAALDQDMPVFGICGGEQLLAVALGGTLLQHIPEMVADAGLHEQSTAHNLPCHEVRIVAGTLLEKIVGQPVMQVNSSHHQAIGKHGRAIVNAHAPDGIIEGIEAPSKRFCLGVQWHPEYSVDAGNLKIFQAFVAAANA